MDRRRRRHGRAPRRTEDRHRVAGASRRSAGHRTGRARRLLPTCVRCFAECAGLVERASAHPKSRPRSPVGRRADAIAAAVLRHRGDEVARARAMAASRKRDGACAKIVPEPRSAGGQRRGEKQQAPHDAGRPGHAVRTPAANPAGRSSIRVPPPPLATAGGQNRRRRRRRRRCRRAGEDPAPPPGVRDGG